MTLLDSESSGLATVGTMERLEFRVSFWTFQCISHFPEVICKQTEACTRCAMFSCPKALAMRYLLLCKTSQHISHNAARQDGEVVVGCKEERGEDGECRGGLVASILHQYDRVKALVEHAQALYGIDGEVFQTFHERHGLL